MSDIFSESPKIEANGFNQECMNLASKTKLKYTYIDRDGSQKTVPIKFNSVLRFDTSLSGSYVGKQGVVLSLSTTIYRSIQSFLDQLGSQGVQPMMISSRIRELSDFVISSNANTWNQYQMVSPELSILTMNENKEDAVATKAAGVGAGVASVATGASMAVKATQAAVRPTPHVAPKPATTPAAKFASNQAAAKMAANQAAAKATPNPAAKMAANQAAAKLAANQAAAQRPAGHTAPAGKVGVPPTGKIGAIAAGNKTPAQPKAGLWKCRNCGAHTTDNFCSNCGSKA